jgi:hypothetical protein
MNLLTQYLKNKERRKCFIDEFALLLSKDVYNPEKYKSLLNLIS